MARFRGTLRGARGVASRLGHGSLCVTANGWDSGVYVRLYIDDNNNDCAEIKITGGSNDAQMAVCIFRGPLNDAFNRDRELVSYLVAPSMRQKS